MSRNKAPSGENWLGAFVLVNACMKKTNWWNPFNVVIIFVTVISVIAGELIIKK